ncbi:MAG: NAD(P)-dependent oxidoreductase [Thermoleophilaceae bacterium]|nr:NAD(P)-dependent oxidoreductase [Thermoleophilaceae bacterium]
MAANLDRAGFEVHVWNRSPERARELAKRSGVQVARTALEAARAAQATITMVVDGPDVEAVLFGPNSAADGMEPGHLCIDMSTIAPHAAVAIGERLERSGIDFLDAPVTGSKPRAEDGTLTIIVGGEPGALERARPLFEAMGELIVHVGTRGKGQVVKLLNNTVAAINAAGLAQALALGRELGADLEAAVAVMGSGSAGSTILDLKSAPMLEHDFEPLFKLEHMLKDVRHCLDAAGDSRAAFSLASEAERMYAKAADCGPEGRDFAAVVVVAEEEIPPRPKGAGFDVAQENP